MLKYNQFAPVYPCKNFNYEPILGCSGQSIVVHNQLAQPVTLQWYTDSNVINLQPGMNRLELPRFQQQERARLAYNACTPRCRLRWCPWTMLQMGQEYRLYESCGELQFSHLAQNF